METNSIANDIYQDRETLLSLYKEMGVNARFAVDKIWTNARFFTTLTSALITITVGANISFIQGLSKAEYNILVSLLASMLPVVIIVISIIAISNLKREYSRFLDWVVVADKLQEKLGLYNKTEFIKYPNDKYLLPERFIANDQKKSELFISNQINKRGTLYYFFRLIHILYIIISIIIIICCFLSKDFLLEYL